MNDATQSEVTLHACRCGVAVIDGKCSRCEGPPERCWCAVTDATHNPYPGRPVTMPTTRQSPLEARTSVTPRYDANDSRNASCVADALADLTEQVARIAEHLANLDKNGIEAWVKR